MARRQTKPAEATKPSVQALHLRTGAPLERWINPSGFSLEERLRLAIVRVEDDHQLEPEPKINVLGA